MCVVVAGQRLGWRKSDMIFSSAGDILGKGKEIQMMGVFPFALSWSEGLGNSPFSVTETQKYVCHDAWGYFDQKNVP
jgi:hypothetical protein